MAVPHAAGRQPSVRCLGRVCCNGHGAAGVNRTAGVLCLQSRGLNGIDTEKELKIGRTPARVALSNSTKRRAAPSAPLSLQLHPKRVGF